MMVIVVMVVIIFEIGLYCVSSTVLIIFLTFSYLLLMKYSSEVLLLSLFIDEELILWKISGRARSVGIQSLFLTTITLIAFIYSGRQLIKIGGYKVTKCDLVFGLFCIILKFHFTLEKLKLKITDNLFVIWLIWD